jgi:hypothetical protein
MRCGKTDALDAFNGMDFLEEGREGDSASIGIDILAEEKNFLYPARCMQPDLVENACMVPADLPTPHIGYDAVGAVIVAALHDVYVCPMRGLHERLFRNDVHGGYATPIHGVHKMCFMLPYFSQDVAQSVEFMGAEHNVHVRHALYQRRPLLLSYAPDHGNDERRSAPLEEFEPAEIAESLLLGLLPDGAGVQDNDIRLSGLFRSRITPFEQFGVELLGVQVIHLTTIGEDLHEAFHGRMHILEMIFSQDYLLAVGVPLYLWRDFLKK